MLKKIHQSMLGNGADYRSNRHFMILPRGWTIQDVLDPTTWAPVVQQQLLNLYDLIRIRAEDGAFDLQFTVVHISKGAANLEIWPKVPNELEALTGERELHVVPVGFDGRPKVRVEEQETSPFSSLKRFRIIALNGEEMSLHPTYQEAEGAMHAYLAKIGYRLPTEAEAKASLDAMQAAEADRQAKLAAKKQAKGGRAA